MAAAAVPFQRRRRHHDSCFFPASYFVAAAIFLLLLFIAILSFLAPPLIDHPSLPNPRRGRSRVHEDRRRGSPLGPIPPRLFVNSFGLMKNAVAAESFLVPSAEASEHDLWRSKRSKYFFGCSNSTENFPKVEAITCGNRYLMIATSGGLNQQRTGITDAVVAARILNATLIVPKLDQKSFWKDASNFSEIFDVDRFISTLSKDVKILKQLPKKGGKYFASPYTMRVPRKCTPRCYQNRVLPVLLKKHVVQLTKFDYRLANKLDVDLQKLRCRVNYHALKFTDSILEMGNTLIKRMRQRSKHFVALHLRFEPDMLAFSGCDYGGGEKERRELGAIRKRWKTLHTKSPEKERRHGKCPLTPEEVGLMLRALGFGNDVHVYVASGEVYGGEETLAPFKALFPNFHSKETLATKEELAPFSLFSSRMAALDFIVCDGSDVFVSNNNGNMARILAGRRRYFGHKRTIRPNAKKLYSLFLNRKSMTWESFASKVRANQRGFMGEPNEVRPGRGEFHENPSSCICESAEAATGPMSRSKSKGFGRDEVESTNETSFDSYDHFAGEELDWPYVDDTSSLEKESSNPTVSEYNLFIRSEEPELEEILSD